MSVRLSVATFLLLLSLPGQTSDASGNWVVTITTPDQVRHGFAAFTVKGEAVTGWIGPSPKDPIDVDGTLKGNRLTIRTHPRPGRKVAFAQAEITVKGDKMAGTIDGDKGTIEFIRSAP